MWPTVLAGAAGAGALLLLALTGRAGAQEASLAALTVAGVTLLCIRNLRWVAAPAAAAGAAPPPAGETFAAYAALIDAFPDPMLVVAAHEPDDVTGRRFMFANAAARELLRIQRPDGLLLTVIRDPEVLEAVDEALFGEIDGVAELELGGSQERIFRALARPMGPGPGGARLALLVLREETEQRRVERTRADFLANASHELRTPLASLAGFIETLRGHARDDAGARDRFLGIMQAQTERMARLIDDLMSLSRIELNEHVAPADAVDLSLVVNEVLEAMGPLARERRVRLEPSLGARGQALVAGDRDQIVQVAQNLIDNAVKYTPAGGGVRVAVETGLSAEAAAAAGGHVARLALLTPDHGPERYAALRVADSGAGIAREHLPRLTERFYRVEGQKSGERSGTGLGLAIVKHIMNRHRGGLAVESRPGEGSTFSAYFPAAAQAAAQAAASTMRPITESKVS
ncbi:ATP-binding protein [Phenylobacterium sp.]|uniref:ATP-binding protein n=1 Tax=Phenylobacterium sp. TaxID=1871053 RepID=UPI002F42C892